MRIALSNRSVFSIVLILFTTILFSCADIPQSKKYEIRAVWMTRFEYARGKSADASKSYIQNSFQKFAHAGLNTIIFQVRGNADAFYHSKYEPWSQMLTDTLGKDPGWDPLAFALEVSRKYGIELHAWLNTFPAWRAGDPLPLPSEPMHPLLTHPEWVVRDSSGQLMNPTEGYITFSPGNPAVREHINNVVLDLIDNYDVDGLHFDYIRYPEWSNRLGYSHDSVSVSRFHAGDANKSQLSWENWQREQISYFVENIYNRTTSRKPWLKISAAVLGFHHGRGWSGYDAVYQDVRRWMAMGKIDLVFPMMYNQIGHPTAPFEKALYQWKEMMHLGRPILPGIGAYKVGRSYDWQEVWDQVELIRKENFPGMVFFSAGALLKGLDLISEKYYPGPSLTTPLSWKPNVPVLQPAKINVAVLADSLEISWQEQSGITKYVIYKNNVIEDVKNLIAIFPAHNEKGKVKLDTVGDSYYITAINRIGLESRPIRLIQDHKQLALKTGQNTK